MRKRSILALAGLAATLAMALGVSSASANNISLSHLLTRAIWSELEFRGGFGTVRCAVTLESSFHESTIRKVLGALIGYVTGATVGTCAQGSATVLRETLPWHIQYGGFRGTLPEFTGVIERLIGASFRIREPIFRAECLARTEVNNPSIGIVEAITWERGGNGIVSRLNAEGGARIPCGAFTGSFEGGATVTENAGAANVLLRLI
ncbi:MAG TPA: hypothetical protein VFU94_07560 [Conexibacter sp.]|nr:hypothetical protein [Conexibacter sp.]